MKGSKKMAPETTQDTTATKPISKTVFDLTAFDDVKLVKTVTLPARPTSIEEALSAVGNDTAALLNVIYDGLCERTIETEKKNPAGFRLVDDEGKVAETDYNGFSADEDQGKLINGAILNLAKMQIAAQGKSWDKSLKIEEKNAARENVKNMFRSNPAMLSTLVPQTKAAAE